VYASTAGGGGGGDDEDDGGDDDGGDDDGGDDDGGDDDGGDDDGGGNNDAAVVAAAGAPAPDGASRGGRGDAASSGPPEPCDPQANRNTAKRHRSVLVR